ncbi:FAR1 DNA-binding domain protein [Opisthorchis viverrini]|uniref:FAR1 DNA-binding domain protein n=2 Tax=Opisthorchis viverrini TaxID=6198 RepID=A0A1S8X211_OPIVI|nr:hypothetical protein T265_11432 [Opisthorchis viverrini]KER19892.1 hypothetical protein T265_11432 [Opisthorchis viverrini]OON20749.1 FAR1 DNA-binding domain protein [Opisthorchis viverrini]
MTEVDAFMRSVATRKYTSWDEFTSVLQTYMQNYHVQFVCVSSKRGNDLQLIYKLVFFRCIRHARRRSSSRGIRRVLSDDTCCPARFCVRNRDGFLTLTSYDVGHNHPLSKELYEQLSVNRHLSTSQLHQCLDVFRVENSIHAIKEYVKDHFGKLVTTKDINNYRRKLTFVLKIEPAEPSSPVLKPLVQSMLHEQAMNV